MTAGKSLPDSSGWRIMSSLLISFHCGSCITRGMNNRPTGGRSSETLSRPIDVNYNMNNFRETKYVGVWRVAFWLSHISREISGNAMGWIRSIRVKTSYSYRFWVAKELGKNIRELNGSGSGPCQMVSLGISGVDPVTCHRRDESMARDYVSELRQPTGHGGMMSTEEISWHVNQNSLAILPAVIW
jgi:hypothetical protein